MKRLVIILWTLAFFGFSSFAQISGGEGEKNPHMAVPLGRSGWSFGFGAHAAGNLVWFGGENKMALLPSGGVNIHITSPWFKSLWWNSFAVKTEFFSSFARSGTRHFPYLGFKLKILRGLFVKNDSIRLYGGGGLLCMFAAIENTGFALGGDGVLGLEVFFSAKPAIPVFFTEIELSGLGSLIQNSAVPLPHLMFGAQLGLRWVLGE